MNNKIINGIEYLVYESGMILNDETKSYYFENDLIYEGDIKCLHFYAVKNVNLGGNQDVGDNQWVGGNQWVRGYQDVRGYQYVGGYQWVGGNQDVGDYQDVRYIYLHLYCKYHFRIDRESNEIKIGCVSKTSDEWKVFFDQKETIKMTPDDRNYKKLALALPIAVAMRDLLIGMNDKN